MWIQFFHILMWTVLHLLTTEWILEDTNKRSGSCSLSVSLFSFCKITPYTLSFCWNTSIHNVPFPHYFKLNIIVNIGSFSTYSNSSWLLSSFLLFLHPSLLSFLSFFLLSFFLSFILCFDQKYCSLLSMSLFLNSFLILINVFLFRDESTFQMS